MTIDDARIEPYTRSLALPERGPELDPELHLLDGPLETRAAFFLTLDAINFGSGWFPTLRKRPGSSGYYTVAWALADHFRAHGPWSPEELELLDGRRVAAVLEQEPAHELMELYDAMGGPDCLGLMLQEHIPGGAEHSWMFNGYFTAGSECLFGWTGRKIRQCPLRTGPTTLGICLPNESVRKTAIDFMRAIGYRGIVDIDFRYDARDGQYKVLDVNPRIGSTFRLFVSDDGMDVARALYLDMTGQPVTAVRACPGRKWIVEDFDLVALFRYRRDGKLTFGEWLRSLRGVRESAFFAMDDLVPMLLMLRADVGEMLRRFRPRSLNTNTAAAVPSVS